MSLATWIWDALPFGAMVMAECADVGVSVLSKEATASGMSNLLFVFYANALATLFILPYFIFNRNNGAPLTHRHLRRMFLLGLIGTMGQTLMYTGIKYSSPTLASAIFNLVPIFTILFAVIFGMEKLNLGKLSGVAKLLGAIVSVSGAFVVTLYKGPSVLSTSDSSHRLLLSQQSNWVFGGFLCAISGIVTALWNVVQAAIVREYPEEMTIVFFYCCFVSIICGCLSLVVEGNPTSWTLKPGIEMIAVAYAALFGNVFRSGVHIWTIHKKGPVYIAMFKPVGIVISVSMAVIFLGETLHLGSVIGSIIIKLGFYTAMWGQAKEKNRALDNEVCGSESSTLRTPLLPSNCNEVM